MNKKFGTTQRFWLSRFARSQWHTAHRSAKNAADFVSLFFCLRGALYACSAAQHSEASASTRAAVSSRFLMEISSLVV